MSFWTPDELLALDYVFVETMTGNSKRSAKSPHIKRGDIRGDGIPRDWDVRQGFGLAGKTQVFMGPGLAEFEFTVSMWELEHRALWDAFDGIVEPSPPGSPERVYLISNPILARRGVTQCVFLNAPFLSHKDDDLTQATYKCRQWRKPLPTLTAPTAPGAATPGGTAANQYQEKIAQQLEQIKQLNGGT